MAKPVESVLRRIERLRSELLIAEGKIAAANRSADRALKRLRNKIAELDSGSAEKTSKRNALPSQICEH